MAKISTDENRIQELLTRSVDTIYPSAAALRKTLLGGRQLTIYVGIDPTANYVHLGHSTNYLILERLHRLGHKIIVLVGDFTAMVGDPSDKTSMRVQLTKDEVLQNLKTFKDQIGKILPFDDKHNPIEFKFNSKWLSTLTFQDAVELASNFTVQQMIERDAFQKRLVENKPLFVHEFFYPLMQGYDSVAMDVDVEVGGTDQTFNMLAGRTLLKRYKNKEKYVITTTLLVNPATGEKMMSKSLGTGVGLNEPPKEMFAKIMRLPDEGVLQCFIDCTRLPMSEVKGIEAELQQGKNPRDVKLRLAKEIVSMYHSQVDAEKAEQAWVAEVSNKELPQDIGTLTIESSDADVVSLISKLTEVSKSEARRLLSQKAVKVNQQVLESETVNFKNDDVLQVGKKHFAKIKIK